jgi:fused signal recognition particle receptor
MADIINKWIQGLDRTRKVTFGKISQFLGASEISPETWDDLEAILIQADLGIDTTQSVITAVQKTVSAEGITSTEKLQQILKEELLSRLDPAPEVNFDQTLPAVILLVGVNGSGKTTSAAKLGIRFANDGKKVLLAAADTFRAAAIDQLQEWGSRLNLPVIAGQPGGDPGAVAFDAIQSAISKKMDIVLIDTAGRLHTRFNLMEELKKVHRVVEKALPGAPHAVWLVLDATTGQNALQQARIFKDSVKVNGIILAKLDSSARGGMAFAIQEELGLPILFAGLGEKPEDLQPFDRVAFIQGMFARQ